MFLTSAPIDLSDDLRYAEDTKGSGKSPSQGFLTLSLCGLYRLQSSQVLVEVEFTEIKALERSLTYVSCNPVYLFLPRGEYRVHYRIVSGTFSLKDRLSIQCIGVFDKLSIYLRKIINVGWAPKHWARIISVFLSPVKRDFGFRLSKSNALISDHNIRVTEFTDEEPSDTKVSIIIPTKIRHDLLRECLESLKFIRDISYEVIIVDNGSTEAAMLEQLSRAAVEPYVRIIRHAIPFNFSRLCNLGAAEARYPLLLFLNDDIEALDGVWLNKLCGFALRPDVGAVGARLLYPSGDLQHGGIASHLIPGPGHPWRHAPENFWRKYPLLSQAGEVDAVTGACLMVKKTVFDDVGGFDEVRFAITINDVDLCLKIRRKGLKIIYAPEATLLHKESQSREKDDAPEQRERYVQELKAYVELYPDYARASVFYPLNLRRDSERSVPISY